jgi:hypothetical protein
MLSTYQEFFIGNECLNDHLNNVSFVFETLILHINTDIYLVMVSKYYITCV